MKVVLLPRANMPGACWAYAFDDGDPELAVEVVNALQALDRGLYRNGVLLRVTPANPASEPSG